MYQKSPKCTFISKLIWLTYFRICLDIFASFVAFSDRVLLARRCNPSKIQNTTYTLFGWFNWRRNFWYFILKESLGEGGTQLVWHWRCRNYSLDYKTRSRDLAVHKSSRAAESRHLSKRRPWRKVWKKFNSWEHN